MVPAQRAEANLPARWRRLCLLVCLILGVALILACQSAGGRASSTGGIAVATSVENASSNAERKPLAQNATWAPGQLQEHFSKHGQEGPYSNVADYDRAARDTVVVGTAFTYVDRESRVQRQGYYHSPTNRFTSLTSDGQRITTFFHPDRRENYIRGLERSTYK
jgi:hypothetical protein